jgi:hypothetical protein
MYGYEAATVIKQYFLVFPGPTAYVSCHRVSSLTNSAWQHKQMSAVLANKDVLYVVLFTHAPKYLQGNTARRHL